MPLHSLLTILADNRPHHITELAHATQRQPQHLNALWQQTPPHIRGLLRQKDGFWQLVRPLALLPEDHSHPHFRLDVLRETTSSNDVLLDAVKRGEAVHRRVVVAHHQTAGRGRQGRGWESRAGECLMFSIGYTFGRERAELGALALVTALACRDALVSLGCPVQIKWPNDLVSGLDKLGGILIETVRRDEQIHAVIGIGINFVLPKTVEHAASVQSVCAAKILPAQLLDAVLNRLHQSLPQFDGHGFAPFQAAYQTAHRDQGREVAILHEGEIRHEGRVLGVAADGTLQLLTEQGEISVASGETSLRLPEQLENGDAPAPVRYLLLDGGNSRLKWAWVENGHITATNQAPYRNLDALNQEWLQYGGGIERVVGAAVCGTAKQAMVAAQLPHVRIEWLGSMKRGLGIYNHYQSPLEHGADRWFNILGSRRFSSNACVVVSCGTAVTVDALTADNHYLGGTIMPGFHLMKESLALKTANLNRAPGKLFPFPTTTANALAGGMMDAVCGSLMLMHSRLQARCGGEAVDVIITGGGAAKVARALPEQFTLDNSVKIVDNLVVFGLLNWIGQA
ncbi:biotin--[acetyl-CoA-carboxylase] ligase [Conchiformibius kuhniae]|uniref:Type III pantothenate kinase n=1 Tax=Conchiformibius kuhniae TaxID=211502 RepID=A0ABD8B7L6_9NEIS|nr:biotin--[acetyl-CoA-carboxylase] ligase [Conchiformibius kuhniae]